MTDEALARLFHDTYERLAPEFGYETREASRKPWEEVPQQNRTLMVAVAGVIAETLGLRGDLLDRLDRFADEADAKVTIARHPGNEPAVRWSAEAVWAGEPPDSDRARLSSIQGGAAAYGTGDAATRAIAEALEDAGA
jgi:hypothetical protein